MYATGNFCYKLIIYILNPTLYSAEALCNPEFSPKNIATYYASNKIEDRKKINSKPVLDF